MEAREGFAAEPTALFCDKKGRPQPWPRPLAPLADTHGHLTLGGRGRASARRTS